MTLDARWNLKWIDAKSLGELDVSAVLSQGCVFLARRGEQVTGFTSFEPRAFNASLVARMERRLSAGAPPDQRWELILPNYLSHRAETLLPAHLREKIEIKYSAFIQIKRVGAAFSVRHRLRVVNVDDSPVMLKYLRHTLEGLGYVDVVGQISDPTKAAGMLTSLKPDFVTMDIQMPGMTGVDVVRRVLENEYYPFIMVSSLSMEDGSLVFDALNAGAFDYVQKPRLEDRNEFVAELQEKMLGAVSGKRTAPLKARRAPVAPVGSLTPEYPSNLIWAFGASTGGTQALTQVFTSMPTSIPPTVVVQHIPPVFSKAFANSLNDLCPFTVQEARDGDKLQSDHVYIAAGGLQMSVVERGGDLYLALADADPVNRFKPSVDYLFASLARLRGRSIVAAILTGMGRDGAAGLLDLKNAGAKTLAQDEKSSTVFGMPRVAIELGAADLVCPLDQVAESMLQTSAKFAARKVA